MSAHNFALYYLHLSKIITKSGQIVINDLELVHRVGKVLRLQTGEELTLFDHEQTVLTQIKLIDKKQLVLNLIKQQKIINLKPKITIALGVLKKENLEQALYGCVELGASQIRPLICAKSVTLNLSHERVQKILIAAAEQSKNFSLPDWQAPILFKDFIDQIQKTKKVIYIYCDINGQAMAACLEKIKTQPFDEIVLIVGPEGDLTSLEQAQLAEHNVLSMQLTPTVLRSFQAVILALGIFRSLFKHL